MTIGTKIGDSIEGVQLHLSTRSFNPVPPKYNETLGQRVHGFRLQIFGESKIKAELEPKEAKIDSGSMLDPGDAIRGERVCGFSSRVIKPKLTSGVTAKHKATTALTREFGYAKIEISIRQHLEKKAKPQVTKNSAKRLEKK